MLADRCKCRRTGTDATSASRCRAFAPSGLPDGKRMLPLDQHRLAHAAGVAEDAQIALDLRGQAGRLLGIVGELDGRMSVDRRHLADQRDWIEVERAVRRA